MIPLNANSASPTFDSVGSKAKTSLQPKPTDSPEEQKLKKSAGDFESILLASMWKSMQHSFAADDDSTDPAHGTLEDWGIEIMSSAVGKEGALGIGNLILKQLEPTLQGQEGQQGQAGGSSGASAPADAGSQAVKSAS